MLLDLTKYPEQTQVLLTVAGRPWTAHRLLQHWAAAALLDFEAPGALLHITSDHDQHRPVCGSCAA